jgi:flavodoxin
VAGVVAYYSRTGKTRFVAQQLAKALGCRAIEISDLKKRRGPIAYMRAARDARSKKRTEIEPKTIDTAEHNLICLGTPVWWSYPTPAIMTLLDNLDIKGKDVVIFATADGTPELAIDILTKRVEEKGGTVVGSFFCLKGSDEERMKAVQDFVKRFRTQTRSQKKVIT